MFCHMLPVTQAFRLQTNVTISHIANSDNESTTFDRRSLQLLGKSIIIIIIIIIK